MSSLNSEPCSLCLTRESPFAMYKPLTSRNGFVIFILNGSKTNEPTSENIHNGQYILINNFLI